MAGAGPNERTTRRLPSWMAVPPANDQARESSRRDSNTVQINEVIVSPQGTDSKSLTTQPKKASSLQEKYPSKVSGFGLVECGRKGRKRRASEQENGADVSMREIVKDKKERRRGRKAQDSVLQKRKKTKSLVAEGDEELTTFASEDDVELTVQDLMSIAEEIIASNKDVNQQRQPLGRPETPMRASGNVKQYSFDAGAIHNENLDDAKHKSNSNGVPTGEETVVSIKRTGDPAQEMLDLFLGPWLRKPVEQKKMSLFVADEVISMQDQKKQSQGLVSAGAASPLKKKSSLKDKVAMFF